MNNTTNTQHVSDIEILIDRTNIDANKEGHKSHKCDHQIKKHRNKTVKYDEKIFQEYIKRAKKSKRNSKIHFRLDKFRESKKNRTTYEQIKYELEKLQLSARYHWIVIFLVALDCFCIAFELLIEFIHLSLIKEEYNSTKEHLIQNIMPLNNTHMLLAQNIKYFHHPNKESDLHKKLLYLEHFFKYLGTTILGLFIIEFFIKALFIPMNFFSKIWEFIDAVIVVLSFSLNIYLFKRSHAVHSIIGLITLLRLWRITEIINGILPEIKSK